MSVLARVRVRVRRGTPVPATTATLPGAPAAESDGRPAVHRGGHPEPTAQRDLAGPRVRRPAAEHRIHSKKTVRTVPRELGQVLQLMKEVR